MLNEILMHGLSLAAIGLVLGVALAVASVIFKVEQDERVPMLLEALPGANCGGCGFSGCAAYAAAVAEGNAPVNLCPGGGASAQTAMARIMGVDAGEFVPQKAVVLCDGSNCAASVKFEYRGIMDCAAADRVGGGPKDCGFGCLGLGTCAGVCSRGAISIKDGVAVIDQSLCAACGLCINACPRGIIVFKPAGNTVYVKCKSADNGALVRKYCSVGCIGCKLCEKACETGAITVTRNVAEIDYEKCTGCGMCAEKCPTKCIAGHISVS